MQHPLSRLLQSTAAQQNPTCPQPAWRFHGHSRTCIVSTTLTLSTARRLQRPFGEGQTTEHMGPGLEKRVQGGSFEISLHERRPERGSRGRVEIQRYPVDWSNGCMVHMREPNGVRAGE